MAFLDFGSLLLQDAMHIDPGAIGTEDRSLIDKRLSTIHEYGRRDMNQVQARTNIAGNACGALDGVARPVRQVGGNQQTFHFSHARPSLPAWWQCAAPPVLRRRDTACRQAYRQEAGAESGGPLRVPRRPSRRARKARSRYPPK